jgi:hypothetical protein
MPFFIFNGRNQWRNARINKVYGHWSEAALRGDLCCPLVKVNHEIWEETEGKYGHKTQCPFPNDHYKM